MIVLLSVCYGCGKLEHYDNKCWHSNAQVFGGKAEGPERGTVSAR